MPPDISNPGRRQRIGKYEILLHIVPELVGEGVRLFDVATLRASLKTVDVSSSDQVVNLRLRVDKAGA